jgi:hypothetical protein
MTTSCHVATPKNGDDEFDASYISALCIKSLEKRLDFFLLFMMHFSDDDIPSVRHRLNEVHRTTALQYFPETPQWYAIAMTPAHIDFMHAYPARIHESQ